MYRTKAYRRFVMKKAKQHVRKILKYFSTDLTVLDDKTTIGKLANHGKLCSCDNCCNRRRSLTAGFTHKLTKRELLSLEELKNYQNY